ncbi:MAG TPA: MFS transporter, partial [Pseudomonas sp.]|nr:MFS transporter [Pseudomonas sp.]
ISAKIEGAAQLFDLAISKGDQGWAVEDDTFPPLSAAAETPLKHTATQGASLPDSTASPRVDRRQR